MKLKNFIIGLVIILVAVIFFFFSSTYTLTPKPFSNPSPVATTTIGGITLNSTGQGTVEIVPINDSKIIEPVPDLNRTTIFSKDLSQEAINILIKDIKSQVDALKKDPTLAIAWNNLGINLKIAGDYTGAQIAWEYATKVNPIMFETFSNLGELYGYYLKDFVKAEADDLMAIKLAPDQTFLYFKASNFYKDVLKNKTKAIAIVEQGLSVKNLSTADMNSLQALLDSLKQ